MSLAMMILAAVTAPLAAIGVQGTAARLTVDVDKPGHRISPTLYGIFFEEINCAGDGGLYAELVRNGSLEDSEKPEHWSAVGDADLSVDAAKPASEKNPHSLRIDVKSNGGAANEGYWGIAVRKGHSYKLSVWVRGEGIGAATVTLRKPNGGTLANAAIAGLKPEWALREIELKPTADEPKAALAFTAQNGGALWLDGVSLFPEKTWKNRANGLRSDLAEMLDGIKPSFMRFPGGCWVEGDTMATSQRWKNTIGPVIDRHTQPNLWGYMSGNGLGFHEYLQLCEDLGAEPLFVINCGMSHREVVPLAKMDEFVQDALDAIEYANGPASSTWGAIRAKNGHPKPFGLKYMEIGNENGGRPYEERYPLFYKAIKSKYPEMHLIADVWGGTPQSARVDIVDEHYYSSPQFFMDNANRYDSYDRNGPKVYVGEYAVTQGCGTGNLIAAIGEAAFMTGMERNSDVVIMASYAPLFANLNHRGWTPDLINFDGSRAYGLPSYYVQQMFSRNRGDVVLPATIEAEMPGLPTFASGGIAVGTWATQSEYKDVKVVKGGKVLFESADGSALQPRNGTWETVDGARRQTGGDEGAIAAAGEAAWSDYTLTLKARKIGGAEGFLIGFGRRDDANWLWWNIGGWGNSRHAIELSAGGGKREVGASVGGRVETNRWYDVKVIFSPRRIRCYLDGKLVQSAEPPAVRPLYGTASRDLKTGEVVLKVVNTSDKAIAVRVHLNGMSKGEVVGKALVLTGEPGDENSLDNPKKVAPKERKLTFSDSSFEHVFPAYSVTVMRLRSKP